MVAIFYIYYIYLRPSGVAIVPWLYIHYVYVT